MNTSKYYNRIAQRFEILDKTIMEAENSNNPSHESELLRAAYKEINVLSQSLEEYLSGN
ncbi:MAG: hypothetical protein VX617_02685 [Pseudomonadota bacterium]|nr:hypothetical protein [Pseudomonadota bacterium]